MIRIFIALLISLIVSHVVSGTESQSRTWEIKPSVCVTALPEQVCEMQISMILPQQLQGQHCLFSNDEEVICWQQPPLEYAFTLALSEDAQLELRDASRGAVFTQLLQVKARNRGRLRRRIRQPWSIF